ncbi:MAG: recombinase family protein [Acidobacteriota bacterium]|nr:recombinase family protein [Acidobacteriota bacterium]
MSKWALSKVRSEHVSRKAVVYLRQSSMKQVRENRESQRLQYALAERARKVGFAEVEVIDRDLGVSAAIGSAREGFDRLVSEVAQGQVGAVVSREVSRLSRTDKDWCHLLEVCQIFDTLIMDEDQVYDLSEIDDQLVLGIKGTMSVVELKVLKMRMLQGRDEKARRGELKTRLAPGFVHDSTGQLVLHPDQRVQDAILRIFRKFRELWSARQVFMWFHENEIMVPVNHWGGGDAELQWKLPTLSFIQGVLRNPVYAGAYVYGRRPVETTFEDGKLRKRAASPREPEECRVFLRDHHEGYIDWQEYEVNRKRLRKNCMRFESDPATAAVRGGHGLLGGVLRCGHCGRKLHVRYWGKEGTTPRYFCKGDYDSGGSYCLSFGGHKVDRRFSEEVLQVLSPLGIEASLRATQELRSQHEERVQALRLEFEQLDFEVQRAFEQYDQVDPRNRLVAAELERRWNAKLDEQERVRSAIATLDADRQPVTSEVEARLRGLGEDFSQVWHDPGCPVELKKKIVHSLIEEITVTLDADAAMLHFVVHWKGGCHTELGLEKPRPATAMKTSLDALEVIRKMAVRYGDGQIAAVLNKSGLRTGRGKRWTQTRVATARRNYSIPGQREAIPDPDILTLSQAARHCSVSQYTIQQLVKCGLMENNQVAAHAPWELRREDLESESVRITLDRLKRTGRLALEGGHLRSQIALPLENKEDDNEGYYE